MVLRYIKDLGENNSLSVRQLTFKTTMILALTRPSRSMDLSKLDIRMRSFTNGGVVFKPTHLSNQSRASKPVEDFFYPSFPQDTYLCPVETLKSYETWTLEFRRMDSDSLQT